MIIKIKEKLQNHHGTIYCACNKYNKSPAVYRETLHILEGTIRNT